VVEALAVAFAALLTLVVNEPSCAAHGRVLSLGVRQGVRVVKRAHRTPSDVPPPGGVGPAPLASDRAQTHGQPRREV
jgi:hypothetical protein